MSNWALQNNKAVHNPVETQAVNNSYAASVSNILNDAENRNNAETKDIRNAFLFLHENTLINVYYISASRIRIVNKI
jgi:hypothetical protein